MPTPPGRTSRKWYSAGYQAALEDILQKWEESGPHGAIDWIANNLHDPISSQGARLIRDQIEREEH